MSPQPDDPAAQQPHEPEPPEPEAAQPAPVVVLATGPGWTAVAKPSGLACHRSALVRDRETLADRLHAAGLRPVHLVHRLDRATSGVLLVAHDPATTRALHDALTGPEARKTYVALVRGLWRWTDPVVIDRPVRDEGGAKEAHTVAEVLAWVPDGRASWVRATPTTGRQHQIRRHLRALDHPILGDATPGDTRENRAWRDRGLNRLALHCARLVLPTVGIDVTAPLTPDLFALGATHGGWDDAAAAEPILRLPPLDAGPGAPAGPAPRDVDGP